MCKAWKDGMFIQNMRRGASVNMFLYRIYSFTFSNRKLEKEKRKRTEKKGVHMSRRERIDSKKSRGKRRRKG